MVESRAIVVRSFAPERAVTKATGICATSPKVLAVRATEYLLMRMQMWKIHYMTVRCQMYRRSLASPVTPFTMLLGDLILYALSETYVC